MNHMTSDATNRSTLPAERTGFRLAPDLANALDSPYLTGGQLTRIRALAAHLAARGADIDQPVGICLRRGPGLIEAILAVWSAGAQYVPLDPEYPPDRQVAILEDSGAELVIVDADTRQVVEEL